MAYRFVGLGFLIAVAFVTLGEAQRKPAPSSPGPRVVPNPYYRPVPIPVNPRVRHASDEQAVEFRSQTVLIQIPTVITDKSGNHVTSLGRSDFRVFEDGREQKIASFEEIHASGAALTAPVPHDGEFSNLGGGEAPRSIAVIVLDAINTPFLDQTYGRKQLIKYLAEQVQPGQVFAVVSIGSRGAKVIHGLTSDPAELVQALNKVKGELPALQGVDTDTQASAGLPQLSSERTNFLLNTDNTQQALQDFLIDSDAGIASMQRDRAIEVTMRSFLNISWLLSGIPGRKSLIWATGGFPFIMDSPGAIPGGYLSGLYERTMEALNDAQISVYPVDVRGLSNYSPASDASQTYRSPQALERATFNRSWLQSSSLDSLRDFAEMTGGRAFYNTNDLATSFRRAAEDSASYYLVGYYLDTKNTKPGWRPLKITVSKPGLEVRARKGFLVTNATMNPELSQQTDMVLAFSSPFDATGIPMSVRWKGSSPAGEKRNVQFGLHLSRDGITLAGDSRLDIEVGALAMGNKTGVAADQFSQTLQSTPKPEVLAQIKADGLTYNNNLQLPPGQYVVRFVVRDNFSGKVGSVSAPLTVN